MNPDQQFAEPGGAGLPEFCHTLLGPGGWMMPVCEIDLRVGGRYRYVWRKESNGTEMAMGGIFREVTAPAKLVVTENSSSPGTRERLWI